MSAFSQVPVLDYSLLLHDSTKKGFIDQLRDAILNVGFLYLANPPVSQEDVKVIVDNYVPALFALSQEEKDEMAMINSSHFLGYSKLGNEYTKGKRDEREQYDFGTPHESRWKEGAPDYHDLWGPSQWPVESSSSALKGFKATFERYLAQVETMGYEIAGLIGESLGIGKDSILAFYDEPKLMQHRAKIVKYPVPSIDRHSNQGVGPHYDAGFLTFLLQASDHRGLQVQNTKGDWIDVPPIANTFVVNIGKALEFVTQGVAIATSHRVVSPPLGTKSPRYSIPFFQNISLNVRLAERVLTLPETIIVLRKKRGDALQTESVNFTEFDREPSGRVNLIGRVKSHPDVAQRHYPTLFRDIFPDGLPAQGSAY